MEPNYLLVASGVALSIVFSGCVKADAQSLIVSSGPKNGTYYVLMEDLKAACPKSALQNEESAGSLQNIDRLLNNKVELGIAQLDALALQALRDKAVKTRIFALFPFHSEEIHIIAKATPREEGSNEVALNTMADLEKRRVGYFGGTSDTLEIMDDVPLVDWQLIPFESQQQAFAALQKNDIDAIVAVGGKPLDWVTKLSREYKLLSIPDQFITKLKNIYSEDTLHYFNLNQEAVKTASIESMLVTRNYKSKAIIKRLKGLRDCAIANIDKIRDTRGTHPKWQEIEPSKDSKWQMFQGGFKHTFKHDAPVK